VFCADSSEKLLCYTHLLTVERVLCVCRRWNTELNKLEEDIKKQLAGVLSDASRPLCSLYGAVIGLFAFGLDVS